MKRKRHAERLYTSGELNRLIDSVLHPLARRHARFYALDGLLHAWVEGNPQVSVVKFAKYNVPLLLSQLGGVDAVAADRMLKDLIRLASKVQRDKRHRQTLGKHAV